MTLLTIGLLGFGAAFTISGFAPGLWAYFGLLFYFALGICSIILNSFEKQKTPLKLTPRVYRLIAVIAVLTNCLGFTLLYFVPVQYLPLLAIALPLVLLIAYYIIAPYEILNKQMFIIRAKKKLFGPQYQNLVRIGITGSYGKTSVKNILAEILAKKYRVVASPASFNTPMGFTRTVLNELKPDTEVLIMEMGARKTGDIKEMCKLFKPHHGILTSVGKAHLETFKTEENIRAEKYQLLNMATDIKIDGAIKTYTNNYETKLLGFHNQHNIGLCVELAKKLGLTDDQMREAVRDLKPTPHRLELVEANGVRILDDSYNSSPHGVRAALDVVAELKGKSRAVVITPGMVELGKSQFDENKKFGELMNTVADAVIIVGETNKSAIDEGYTGEKHFVKNLEEGKTLFGTILNKGDVLLIENDLPDNF